MPNVVGSDVLSGLKVSTGAATKLHDRGTVEHRPGAFRRTGLDQDAHAEAPVESSLKLLNSRSARSSTVLASAQLKLRVAGNLQLRRFEQAGGRPFGHRQAAHRADSGMDAQHPSRRDLHFAADEVLERHVVLAGPHRERHGPARCR